MRRPVTAHPRPATILSAALALTCLAGAVGVGALLPARAQEAADPETTRRTQEERDRRAQNLRQIEEALTASPTPPDETHLYVCGPQGFGGRVTGGA